MKIIKKDTSFNRIPLNYLRKGMFVLICCLTFSTSVLAAPNWNSASQLSLNFKNRTLSQVIREIESKSDCIFLFQDGVVDSNKLLTVSIDNKSLEEALDLIFKESDNSYRIDGRQVIVGKKANSSQATNKVEQSTSRPINGKIVDTKGEPIVGASVVIKGTTKGSLSDVDGNFTINQVPQNATLVVSYVGYKTQELKAVHDKPLKIVIAEDELVMDEIVVVGYGTQRRSLVTSAISKMTVDDASKRQVTSPAQLLDGRVAGVSVSSGSGNLGSGERLSIRGISSLSASNEPLYVVDGIPINNSKAQLFNFGESMSSLSTLNLNDIESIDILKDAASAAIYGSRATNGVVVITTKSGKEGKAELRVNLSTGFSKFANKGKIKFGDSDLYLLQYNEGIDNYNKQYGLNIGDSNYKKRISNPFEGMPDTDWLDYILQTGTFYNADAAVSGGNKATKYYMGVNYTDQRGVVKDNSIKKYNFRLNLVHQFTPWLEVGANNTANFLKNNQIPGAGMGSTIIARAVEQRPFDRPYKPNGDYYIGGTDELTRHNPVQILKEQDAYYDNYRFLGNYYAMLKFMDKLTWKYSFNADVGYTYDYKNYNENHPYGGGGGRVQDMNRLITNYVSENVVTYNDKFFKDLSVSAMLGQSYQTISSRTSQIDGRGFPSPSFSTINTASEIFSADGYTNEYAMLSYFGRTTLSFKDRYILTATLRTDGSSKFHKDNRWGWFPSVSAGWNISEEDFMKDTNVDLKFRASYGKTGNQEGIGYYSYLPLINGGRNYDKVSGIAIANEGNTALTWETANQYDIGFDASFLNGKINTMVDFYMKDTNNLLYSKPTPGTTGFTSVMSNIGTMRNYGIEFTLNTHLRFGEFDWLSQFNISSNRNKIRSLIGDDKPISIGDNRALQVGKEMGAFYLFQQEGIYQYDGEVPQEQYEIGIRAGDVKWRDVDNNNIINDNDRVVMGSANPDFFGGWNNTFRYKGFDLDVFLTYSYGNDVYAAWKATGVGRIGYRFNVLQDNVNNRWQGPGTTNKYPRAIDGDTNNARNSDRFLEDGSFIRLRSLTFGYNFPQKWTSKIYCKNLRAFFQADNLFLLTKYSGWDPEVNSNMDPQYLGTDLFNVPQPRTFSFGLSLTL